jgi:hypothetical protein
MKYDRGKGAGFRRDDERGRNHCSRSQVFKHRSGPGATLKQAFRPTTTTTVLRELEIHTLQTYSAQAVHKDVRCEPV